MPIDGANETRFLGLPHSAGEARNLWATRLAWPSPAMACAPVLPSFVNHDDAMRLNDFFAITLAFISILFPTPDGLWGLAYGVTASICLLVSVILSLNWQALPAYLVLFIRLVLVDYFHIHVGPVWSLFLKLVGLLLLSASSALQVLMPIPVLPSLWQRPVCTQELNIEAPGKKAEETRTMRLRVWAPAVPGSGSGLGPKAPYLTQFGIGSVLAAGLSNQIPPIFVSHIALARSNSTLSEQISRERVTWPLLLLSHGLSGTPELYTTFGEQLASLGFVVIGPAHTDGSCSESYVPVAESWDVRNKQLNQRLADMQAILDALQRSSEPGLMRLASRINFQTVGICGHSFGGATAAHMLHKDERISSGVSWDGWMYPLATPSSAFNTKPFLFINSDGFHWEDNITHMRNWCAHNSSGGHIVTLKGTSHHNFNDLPFFGHHSIIKWIARNSTGWFGDTDPVQATKISVSLAAAFFAKIFQTDSPPDAATLKITIRECLLEHTSKVIVDYVPPTAPAPIHSKRRKN